jgi:hypothetical protein
MRTRWLTGLAALLSLVCCGPAVAADEPRTLIEKAIKAQGGEEVLGRRVATQVAMKGSLHVGGTESIAFTGVIFTQPEGTVKYTLNVTFADNKIGITQVIADDKGWRKIDGAGQNQIEDLDEANLDEARQTRYFDRVVSLLPLLKDKGFTLKSLGAVQVRDKPALGVQVSSKGQPDVKLFFDQTSGLLVKTAYRYKRPTTNKEELGELYYSDYREPDYAGRDERILKAAKLAVDGPALLEFLRKKAPPDVDPDKIKALIRKLGDDSFQEREKAMKDLIALGTATLPQLRHAAKSSDAEIKRRAKRCLAAIGDQKGDTLTPAVVRLVGLRKPAGATEVLLTYLTRTDDEDIAREVMAALANVALVNGKPDQTLLKALEDKNPVRRAAATAVLGKDGGAYDKKPGRRLYLTGIKYPMKAVQYRDGKKEMEREYSDVEFFNRFDDSVFAKPK